ncbi:ABC transporter substrate-binding protein [Clostridium oryzae]|uniref:Heme-binding protein A n=1 Tax=Clostridium oryzae TaxID=1450648 RepID=A0A1V4IEM6_9CLOT|nr:ABC transporter substrate-binding protein [Clostridium oryzae]OPJ58403.1 heme-binding protein A precursor [Clostridium oryzae]
MIKFKRTFTLITSLLIAASVFTSCTGNNSKSSSSKKSESVLNIAGFSEDPGTADAQKRTDTYLMPLNLYDRLVETETVDGKPKQVPSLATKWDVSSNGLIYTFHLKKGIKFTNGEEFKADDVLFTFDRMLDPKTKALNTNFLDMIKGAKARMSGKANSVSGIKVLDDYTIKITLDKPFAPFIADLATPACSIYNRKATEAAGSKFGTSPSTTVGTGPFKIKSWKLNSQITLVPNKNYFKGAPKLFQLNIKVVPDAETQKMMFETGRLDVLDLDNVSSQAKYFQTSPKWKNHIVSGQRVGINYYALNEKFKPLDNVKVRKAIEYAIDRKTILEKIQNGNGQLENGIMPHGLDGFNANLPEIEYNKTKAKQLLKEAGYPNGFTMEIAQDTDSPNTLKLNQTVQAMLADVGIKVKIKQIDDSTYYATRAKGLLPTYTSEWAADYNDPDNFIYTFFAKDNSFARSFNYKNKAVFNKVEEARKITDQSARIKLYQDIEKTIVNDDVAWIPLYSRTKMFVIQPYVKSFNVAWNGWGDMKYSDVTVK